MVYGIHLSPTERLRLRCMHFGVLVPFSSNTSIPDDASIESHTGFQDTAYDIAIQQFGKKELRAQICIRYLWSFGKKSGSKAKSSPDHHPTFVAQDSCFLQARPPCALFSSKRHNPADRIAKVDALDLSFALWLCCNCMCYNCSCHQIALNLIYDEISYVAMLNRMLLKIICYLMSFVWWKNCNAKADLGAARSLAPRGSGWRSKLCVRQAEKRGTGLAEHKYHPDIKFKEHMSR